MRRIENEKRNTVEMADLSDIPESDKVNEKNDKTIQLPTEKIHTLKEQQEEPRTLSKDVPSVKLPPLFSHVGDSDTAFIIGIMFLLFQEGCQDWILFCILGYLIF